MRTCSNSLPLLRLYGAQNYELSIWGVCLPQLSPILPQRRALPSSGSQTLTSPSHLPAPCHYASCRTSSLLFPMLFSLYLFVSVSLSPASFSSPASLLAFWATLHLISLFASLSPRGCFAHGSGFSEPTWAQPAVALFPFRFGFLWRPSRTEAFDIAASSRAFGTASPNACRICAVVASALPFLL